MNLGTIYLTSVLIFVVLGLIIYGVDKTRPEIDRVFEDKDSIPAIFFCAFFWPILVGIGIFYCLCKLPILLGECVGNKYRKYKAKKDFKELINKN